MRALRKIGIWDEVDIGDRKVGAGGAHGRTYTSRRTISTTSPNSIIPLITNARKKVGFRVGKGRKHR